MNSRALDVAVDQRNSIEDVNFEAEFIYYIITPSVDRGHRSLSKYSTNEMFPFRHANVVEVYKSSG